MDEARTLPPVMLDGYRLLQQPDTESRVAKRFVELQAKAREFRGSAQKHRKEIRARAWNLSQPGEAYAGIYSNELLGDMTVALDDAQQMSIRWGRLQTTATGYEQEDHFRVEFAPNSGKALSFRVDRGRVEAISFEGMEFVKTE